MPYSVLIVDDDGDFNSLLTDIFEQADYIVTSLTDPKEAIEAFRETDFDLVVTDQRMPEVTGEEFMKFVKAHKPKIPVIMVSGYLENDTIRDLIRDGVGGVFLKPLNIFSLLERTNELIEEAKRLEGAAPSEEEEAEDLGGEAGLGFTFRSFPCKTGASAAFAERLFNLKNFKSTLSLIGEPGMHYRAICEDIRDFYDSGTDRFIFLSPSSFDSAQLRLLVEDAKNKGAERVTCVLLDLVSMNAEQKAMATSIPKGAAPFDELGLPLRAIYCVSGDLDQLFDDGVIDENLYIMIGTAEVAVPSLNQCRVDTGIMAEQLFAEIAREKGFASVPPLEKSARDLFGVHKWERNYEELRESVEKVLSDYSGDLITQAVVKEALTKRVGSSAREAFERFLENQRADFVAAAGVLLGGDQSKVGAFFSLNEADAPLESI